MRRLFLPVLILLGVALTGAPVLADNGAASDLSDTQVAEIRQNCKQAQSVLQRLQTTDVVTRVTRGQIYENLINRLITPFDSRVSLNRYDATGLTLTAGSIDQKFGEFKTDYSAYADSFSSLLAFDCQNDPRGFYTLLSTTRDQRTRVAGDIADLDGLLDAYETAFSSLASSIEGTS